VGEGGTWRGHSRLPHRESDLRQWLHAMRADSFFVVESTSL